MPVEIFITQHARLRMIERFRCKENKIQKVAKKAWFSKEKIKDSYLNNKIYYSKHKDKILTLRSFCGLIFVFIENGDQKRLITLYTK